MLKVWIWKFLEMYFLTHLAWKYLIKWRMSQDQSGKFSFKMSRLNLSPLQCHQFCSGIHMLTHWGRVMHICVSKLTIIGSDNVLSPDRHQAIIWNNAGILLIGPLGTNFNEILVNIHIISFKKIHLKMSSGNGGHLVSASMCSLARGRCGCNAKLIIFKLISRIDILTFYCEIALRWTPQDLANNEAIFVEIIDWYRQAETKISDAI